MNLHSEIMNIPVQLPELGFEGIGPPLAYKIGHRAARHAAAELSLKVEARIEELEEELNKARQLLLNTVNPFASKMTAQEIHTAILDFLEENK